MNDVKQILQFLLDPNNANALFGGHKPPHWYPLLVQFVLWPLLTSVVIAILWKNLHEPIKAFLEFLRQRRATPAQREEILVRQQIAKIMLVTVGKLIEEEMWLQWKFTDVAGEFYPGLETT